MVITVYFSDENVADFSFDSIQFDFIPYPFNEEIQSNQHNCKVI